VERYDVVIAGGGVAGALAGYTTARLGHRTAIIDKLVPHQTGEGLAADAATVLVRLGLSEILDRRYHVPCEAITCVTSEGSTHYPWKGFILNRARFNSDLLRVALAAGCERLHGEVIAVTRDPQGNGVLASVKTASAVAKIGIGAMIDATGRNAAIARRLGAARKVLTTLAAAWISLPTNKIATVPGTLAIEATGAHWCYVAVGRQGTTAAILGRHPPRDSASWFAAAGRTNILASLDVRTLVQPTMRAANVSILVPVCGDRWLSCGDATATFDPLSGYGLSFAIGTGYAAGRAADALLRGDSFGALAFRQLVSDRFNRAWQGLGEAYGGLVSPHSNSVRSINEPWS
jgi:flavin-dependent dehydrogenase